MVDILIDTATRELVIDNGQLKLTQTKQELTKQRLDITLNTYRDTWGFNLNFGIPYYQEIFGKNTKQVTDLIFSTAILNTPGVLSITGFESSISPQERIYSLTFSAEIESGELLTITI